MRNQAQCGRIVIVIVGGGGVQAAFEPFQPGSDIRTADDAFQRIGGMALPITVEVLRNLRHDGAAHHHVGVGKGVFAVDVEIFVADIAPADNADAVVGNQGFVVHPAV